MSKCNLCPRGCLAERELGARGFCSVGSQFKISKIMLHPWEEPCISGRGGAGTVFFAGCNLHCVYCQNKAISNGGSGREMNEDELENKIFSLVESGAECIEFVTPTHYTLSLARLLERIKPKLQLPVVWNSSGYESLSSLSLLDGLVDIYLPDFKYFSSELAKKYSSAENYPEIAILALKEMKRQVGLPQFDTAGMMRRGLIVRHLVLPSHRKDSIDALKLLAKQIGVENMRLSLMSQYTPDFYTDGKFKNLERRVTSFEYNSVMSAAIELGFEGYFQQMSSSDKKFTPIFE